MIKDVINKGVSLRFWDQKNNKHIWHRLFLPGQTWPTTNPLEIILSASKKNQKEIELKIADNEINNVQEVIYINGIPIIQDKEDKFRPQIKPWGIDTILINLEPPANPGTDCLKLKFNIDEFCQLTCECIDLRTNENLKNQILGKIR